MLDSVSLFAPAATRDFGARVAAALGVRLSASEEREFGDGEHKMRPLESVRQKSVYVIQSMHGDAAGSPNDKLCRLLFFIGALKDAGARCVTACVPYLAYAREDRCTEARDPVTTRYVAQLIEAVGTDRVITLDVHNLAAFENAFRCETIHVQAADYFVQRLAVTEAVRDLVVASPDIGGIKRARHFQECLQAATGHAVGVGFMDKRRSGNDLSGEIFVGDVTAKRVILVDDLVSSGSTLLRAAAACRRAGATRVEGAVTHATFAAEAARLFGPQGLDSVTVTDSVALAAGFSENLNRSLHVLEIAPLFAETIRRLEHSDPATS